MTGVTLTEKIKITKYKFYFETSLYEEIKIEELENGFFGWDVDALSFSKNEPTTYKVSSRIINERDEILTDYGGPIDSTFQKIILTCKRKEEDVVTIYIFIGDSTIQKIWQYPSIADINSSELKEKYSKALDNNSMWNLFRAIWLFSHWIWAGSFVYLRRIFENLIIETFNENIKEFTSSTDEFSTKNMSEKISILAPYLPPGLVQMKQIYWIWSKWVHELTEEECLTFFPAIKLSIELILDQKIEIKRKKEDEHRIGIQISKIWSLLN